MMDPTSELGDDVTAADAPDCAVCGTSIVSEPDHRVATWVEAGAARTDHFCSDDCLNARER